MVQNMANAMRAAATRPKVEPAVMTEAPLAGAVRTDEVARPGAVAEGAPAAMVELPLGNGATLGRAGPGRLEVVAAVVAATEIALVVAAVLGAGVAGVAIEMPAELAEEVGAETVGDDDESATESQESTFR